MFISVYIIECFLVLLVIFGISNSYMRGGVSVARWVVLKFEKPSKIPHFHKFVSFGNFSLRAKIPQIQTEFPHH